MKTVENKYNDYTLGLALFDAVPVFLFLLSGLVIYALSGSVLVIAGAVAAFAGGLCKVIWKIRIVHRGTDSPGLTKAFHILLPLGLGLMAAAAVAAAVNGKGGDLVRAVTMMPAALFFAASLAGACLMGWLGGRLDNSARSNWIEEIINTAWQAALLIGVVLLYFTLCYPAGDAAKAALDGSGDVIVTVTEDAYIFDGEGHDAALIFYPGAKVEAAAYAPLMERIAEGGTDCYLCRMPGNFAFFGKGMADDIRESYSGGRGFTGNGPGSTDNYSAGSERGSADNYKKWYIGGHSLGGAVAAMLAEDEDWSGLILLAAYPTGAIDEPVLILYGSEDRVLNMKNYEEASAKGFWPEEKTEIVIEGGNHAGFGDYGEQKGDGIAAITAYEQQQITADAIISFTQQ